MPQKFDKTELYVNWIDVVWVIAVKFKKPFQLLSFGFRLIIILPFIKLTLANSSK